MSRRSVVAVAIFMGAAILTVTLRRPAVMVSAMGYLIKRHIATPLMEARFHVPSGQVIDRELVLGAAIFGIGWGLIGLCPAPALVDAALGLPQAAYQPAKQMTYKVVFSMTRSSQKPGEVNPSLERVARAVNLYASAGVPMSHLKFVAIASGGATPMVLDDAHYQTKFGMSNPNLPVIKQLKAAGIDAALSAHARGVSVVQARTLRALRADSG